MAEEKNERFAQLVRERMGALNLTNREVGEIAGVSGSMVSLYRGGSVPGAEKMEGLARALQVPLPTLTDALKPPPERNGTADPDPAPPGSRRLLPMGQEVVDRVEARRRHAAWKAAADAAHTAAVDAGLVDADEKYLPPFAVINGAFVPLPVMDALVDPVSGRPLVVYTPVAVMAGPPRVQKAPAPAFSSAP